MFERCQQFPGEGEDGGDLEAAEGPNGWEQGNLLGMECSLVWLYISVDSTQMIDDVSSLLEEEKMLSLLSFTFFM